MRAVLIMLGSVLTVLTIPVPFLALATLWFWISFARIYRIASNHERQRQARTIERERQRAIRYFD